MKLGSMVCALALIATTSVARAEPTTLRFGVIANSMHDFTATVYEVAQQKGMLDRQGVKLAFVPLAGTDHMIAALDDGSVDISSTALPYLIKGQMNGSDAVAVVGGPANTIYSLVAKPDIHTFADLKGKIIGLSLPVDVISIGARALLAKHGIDASDFTSKQLIGTPVRAKCLKDSDCAATPLTQPDDFTFARAGYHILGTSQEVLPHMQFTVVAARRAWVARNGDLMVRFAHAMGDAYAYMRDPSNRSTVIAMASAVTGAPTSIVTQIYDLYYRPDRGVMPKHAEIDVEGVSNVIDLLEKAGELHRPPAAEDIVDLQVLQAAGLQ